MHAKDKIEPLCVGATLIHSMDFFSDVAGEIIVDGKNNVKTTIR